MCRPVWRAPRKGSDRLSTCALYRGALRTELRIWRSSALMEQRTFVVVVFVPRWGCANNSSSSIANTMRPDAFQSSHLSVVAGDMAWGCARSVLTDSRSKAGRLSKYSKRTIPVLRFRGFIRQDLQDFYRMNRITL